MPTTAASPSSPPRPARRPVLFVALLVVGIAYLVSLPWQRRQWEATRKIQAENAIQEARIRQIKAQQDEARAAEKRLQTNSGDVNAQLDAARAALSHSDNAQAGLLLERIERETIGDHITPDKVPLLSALAGMYQQAEWIDRAVVNAQRAVDIAPDNVEALLRLGVIEAQIGWQDESQRHIAAARKLAPDAAEPHLALALLFDQVGAGADAEKELLAADRLRPHDEHITLLLFQNQMGQRQYAKALQTAEEALKAHPASTEFIAGRAEALIEQGLSVPGKGDIAHLQAGIEAAQQFQRIAPDSVFPHYLLGRAFHRLGDEAKAQQEWEIVYASPQKDGKMAISFGRLLVRRGERERGRQMMEAGEKQRAESGEYNRLLLTAGMARSDPEKQRDLARWCQARNRFSHAILGWDQVLRLKPTDAEALREREKCVLQRASRRNPG